MVFINNVPLLLLLLNEGQKQGREMVFIYIFSFFVTSKFHLFRNVIFFRDKMFLLTLYLTENADPQASQYGFSSVCVSMRFYYIFDFTAH